MQRGRRAGILATVLATVAVLVTGLAAAARSGGPGTVAAGPFTLVAEPQAGVAPFTAMIASARHSVDLDIYELTDPVVERALAGAARRGVDVRVLVNGYDEGTPVRTNAPAARYLSAHGVHVRVAPRTFPFTHIKALTVDGRQTAVMSLNLDGGYASTRDFAVLDRRRADVAAVVAVFDADWAGRAVRPSSGSGDLLWSPGAAPAVLRAIASARRSIDLEDEEMAYPPATAALCAAAHRGVAVHVVMTWSSEWYRPFRELSRCGVSVRLYHGQRYYIHAKLLIVDGDRALLGSQNLSETSLQRNRELSIDIVAAPLVRALTRDFAADEAGAVGFYR